MFFELPTINQNIYEFIKINNNESTNYVLKSLLKYYNDTNIDLQNKDLQKIMPYLDYYYYLYYLYPDKNLKLSNLIDNSSSNNDFFIIYETLYLLTTNANLYNYKIINYSKKNVGYFSQSNSNVLLSCIQQLNSTILFGNECNLKLLTNSQSNLVPFDLLNYKSFLHYSLQFKKTLDFIIIDIYNNVNEINMSNLLIYIFFALLSLENNGIIMFPISINLLCPLLYEVLYLLSSVFKYIHIVKPSICRFDNETIYIICVNYKFDNIIYNKICNISKIIIENINSSQKIFSILLIDIPIIFLEKLQEIFIEIGSNEMENKLAIINKYYSYKKNSYNQQIQQNLSKSVKWCLQYNIPFNDFS